MAFYLSLKEIWRNKWRFLAVCMVIALITTLVLFIAALAEGLGDGNREYIQNLNAELVLYQENSNLSISSSRIGRSELNDIRRLEGVADAGPIGFGFVSVMRGGGEEPLDVSLIGAEPGRPGMPLAREGENLRTTRGREALIDSGVAIRTGLNVGDTFTIKTVQGTDERFFDLRVVGITESQQYSIQPAVIVPFLVWDELRPQAAAEANQRNLAANIVAVKLVNPSNIAVMQDRITTQLTQFDVADIKTAYENTPGYSAQQSTLDTQRYFTLLIGVLVIGGFFQIQMLQKIAQVGMLKAIGAPNLVIATAAMAQIIIITIIGVLMGTAGTLALSLVFPPTVPIVFTSEAIVLTVLSLMAIGPIGGLVSIRIALKVEPLTALGLAS
jgi:putative ABC transport system permease protein